MVAAPNPADEGPRSVVAEPYEVLGSEPEPVFDALVALAAQVCAAPIALLDLIETKRRWFKALYGVDAADATPALALGAYANLSADHRLEVRDARGDARFAAAPLIIAGQPMRSFAGVPLVGGDGRVLGSLRVVDTVPRDWTADQLATLNRLAHQAAAQVELRLELHEAHTLHRDSEQFYDKSLDLLCVSDANGFFTRVNAAFTQTLGYSIDELTGAPFTSFVHPDDIDATLAAVEELAAGTDVIDFENRYRCRDGSYRRLSWRSAPDAIDGLHYSIARDVTDARAAAKAAQALTAQLIDAAPCALFLTDEHGTISLVNHEIERMFGYAREEIVGEPVQRLIPAATPDARVGDLATHIADVTRRMADADLFGRHMNGRRFPIKVGLSVVQAATGPTVLTSVVDISEQTAHMRYLQTQLAVLRLTATDGEPEATTTALVTLVARRLGWQAGEFWRVDVEAQVLRLTNSWSDGQRPNFTAASQDAVMASGVGMPGIVWASAEPMWLDDASVYQGYPRAAAATRDGLCSGVGLPVLDHGQVIGVLAFFTDRMLEADAQLVGTMETTAAALGQWLQRRQAEDAMLQAQQAAEQANQAKSAFLANMGHEIRTPMNAVIGLTHLALRTQLTGQQRDYLDKIALSARNLLEIINDLLDFSKIEATQLRLDIAPFSLDALLSSLSSAISAQANQRGIELIFDVAADLPDQLVGDRVRVLQVLTNLCSNAVKFTDLGEVVVRLSVVARSGAQIRLRGAVRDTGIGLNLDRAGCLFEPFGQADASTSRRYGGTGLGLSICKRLIDLMGGTIEVESAVGVGSTFSFEIDLTVADEVDRAAQPQLSAGLRALVVDDNASARLAFAEMLAGWRVDVSVATSGGEALAAITRAADGASERAGAANREAPFDVIVLDWQMPGIDGLEVARVIHETLEPAVLPTVVLVTAFSHPALAQRALAAGVRRVLTKPVSPSTLFNTLIAIQHPPSASRQEVSEPHDLEARWRPRLQGAKVLVAEDNAINQQIAVELLQSVGVEVIVAVNGTEVLARIDTDVDAVLMDLQMPGMDGITATQRMLARPEVAHIPVIAMTANAMVSNYDEAQAAGMKGFVSKPVEPQTLYATLAQHLPAPDVHTSSPAPRRSRCLTTTASRQRWQTPSASSVQVPLPSAIEGIDLDDARRRLAGNELLLAKLLARFVHEQADVSMRIAANVTAGDNQTAVREAHTLKGLAASLGMADIAALAAALEAALVEQRPVDALIAPLSDAVDVTVDRLTPLLAPPSAQPPHAVDDVDVSAALAQLMALLAKADTAAVPALELLLVAAPSGPLHHALRQALAQLADYDFDAARATLDGASHRNTPSRGGSGA